jgi:ADP-ribose pyrophosphatase YjhB (NUDIX family)
MEDNGMKINFCSRCGAPMEERIPVDDDHIRSVCTQCPHVHYENPKMVVGCIPVFEDRILLCKRNIEPRKGKWTLPAGYLENKESVQDGAVRETLEETRADVEIEAPYRLFNIVNLDQIYLMFRARMVDAVFGSTKESSEVRLFKQADIPWDELAFEVIRQTLIDFFQDRKQTAYPFEIKEVKLDRRRIHL